MEKNILSENSFKNALDVIFCAIVIVDENKNVIYTNTSAKNAIREFNIDINLLIDKIDKIDNIVNIKSGSGRCEVNISDRRFICNVNGRFESNIRNGANIILHESHHPHCSEQQFGYIETDNKELSTIIESSHDGIVVTDRNGKVVRSNFAAERFAGCEKGELKSKTIKELFVENIIDLTFSHKAIEKGESVSEIIVKDGRRIIATAHPVKDERGEITSVVINLNDISATNKLIHDLEYQKMLAEGYLRELEMLKNEQSYENDFISYSSSMQRIMHTVNSIASIDPIVLITGESGTGKEVIANKICSMSSRKNKPIIKINCGAIPANLFESELFGYEDGAFTGARKKGKPGFFELANGGTLFLDEIGEMSLETQVKLLRAIQNGEIIRVGGTKTIKVDARIIASTNQDLPSLIEEGKFRRDLYYRLNVINIKMPPLRERKEDIVPLAMFFLGKYNKKYGKNKLISTETGNLLKKMEWKGNIRELENVIESLVILSRNDLIVPDDLPDYMYGTVTTEDSINIPSIMPLKEATAYIEQQMIKNAKDIYSTTTEMAAALGVDQSTISRKMKQYNIK